MSKIVAITVSTKYDDLLEIIMPQNYKFFDKWYIVTHKNDIKTIDVINKFSYSNVITLYYDFYSNVRFNKGGAIKYCQKEISKLDYDFNVLLLDSDIYLPDNFDELLNNLVIEPNVLYGVSSRFDYHSYDNFLANKIDSIYTRMPASHMRNFVGFFQLYKHNPTFLYENSQNCAECDTVFFKYFSQKKIIEHLSVKHLGKEVVNWNGRNSTNDFYNSKKNITLIQPQIAEQTVQLIVEPKINPIVGPIVEPKINPIVSPIKPIVEPKINQIVSPIVSPIVEPKISPIVSPIVSPIIPIVEPKISPIVSTIVSPIVSPIVEPKINPIVSPIVSPIVEPKINPIVSPIVSSIVNKRFTDKYTDITLLNKNRYIRKF